MNLINGLANGEKNTGIPYIYFMGKSWFPWFPVKISPRNQASDEKSHKEQRNSMNSGELFGLRGAFCSAEPKGWLKNPWV